MHNCSCTCSPTFHCKYERTCACTRSRVPLYEGTTNPYLASYVNMYLRILLSSKISSYLRTFVLSYESTTQIKNHILSIAHVAATIEGT
jgi:hypothetical protein